MKKHLLLWLSFSIFSLTGFAQIGIGTTAPDSSALMDLSSANKGFLPPRVALVAGNDASPVANPATGLLVYNTATAGTAPNNVSPGYYYWNGTAWYAISKKGAGIGDMQYWNGTQWINIPAGEDGLALISCDGIPKWGGCPEKTITITTNNSVNEITVFSYSPSISSSGDTQLTIGTWTVNGTPVSWRIYMKFNYVIPAGATILSAKLSFYAMPNPHGGNSLDAHFGPANALNLQRITADWVPATTTWNNQPAISAVNKVVIPQSVSAAQNMLDLNVTELVKDMQLNGNNGFSIRLATENYYNIRQYVSSFNTDASKHPTLVITYK